MVAIEVVLVGDGFTGILKVVFAGGFCSSRWRGIGRRGLLTPRQDAVADVVVLVGELLLRIGLVIGRGLLPERPGPGV